MTFALAGEFLFAEVRLAVGVRGPFGILLAEALRGVLFVVDGFLFVVFSSFSSSGGFAMAAYFRVRTFAQVHAKADIYLLPDSIHNLLSSRIRVSFVL